jgi:hypothetical protein
VQFVTHHRDTGGGTGTGTDTVTLKIKGAPRITLCLGGAVVVTKNTIFTRPFTSTAYYYTTTNNNNNNNKDGFEVYHHATDGGYNLRMQWQWIQREGSDNRNKQQDVVQITWTVLPPSEEKNANEESKSPTKKSAHVDAVGLCQCRHVFQRIGEI